MTLYWGRDSVYLSDMPFLRRQFEAHNFWMIWEWDGQCTFEKNNGLSTHYRLRYRVFMMTEMVFVGGITKRSSEISTINEYYSDSIFAIDQRIWGDIPHIVPASSKQNARASAGKRNKKTEIKTIPFLVVPCEKPQHIPRSPFNPSEGGEGRSGEEHSRSPWENKYAVIVKYGIARLQAGPWRRNRQSAHLLITQTGNPLVSLREF